MMKYLINLTNFDWILSPLLQQIIFIFHKSRTLSIGSQKIKYYTQGKIFHLL